MKEQDIILQKNRELSAVLEASRVLTASFDLEGNLINVMQILGRRLEMQRGCVFLLDPISGDLRIVAAHGLKEEEIRRGKYRIGEGIVGQVIESGLPMFIPDIGEEPKFLDRTRSRPKKQGISFLSVPIGLEGKTFGAISVDRIYSEEHGGVDDDLRVLGIMASLIAQFVRLWENFKKVDAERETLRHQLKDRFSLTNIVGESAKFQAVLKTVHKVANTDATVLLLGESGTGKELIAKTLHFKSKRANGPFVAVNCAAFPEGLLEVELFGSEKGAFTGATSKRIGRFELARGGTIFLDEIAELPLALQPKLLRVLENRTFEPLGSSKTLRADVRVIAATNRDIESEVKRGSMRADLYWRLNVLPILLPPLRERGNDILFLVNYYLKKFNDAYRKDLKISDEAMKALASYQWPGNVRELSNVLERLVIIAEGNIISGNDLPRHILHQEAVIEDKERYKDKEASLPGQVKTLELLKIINALKENNLAKVKAARALGITVRQLGYRIKKYHIDIGGIQ